MPKQLGALALIVAILFSACAIQTPSPGWPVVSEITATIEQNGFSSRQTYTDSAKMRQILNLLRNLGQQFTPFVDPNTLSAPCCSICVSFTDGKRRVYQIKADRYIRTDSGPWQQADPERIEKLRQLIQTLPGDFIPV